MKESKSEKFITLIAIIVVIAGIIIIATKGFNFDLQYQQSQRIEVSIGKSFEISDIEEICKEVLGEQKVIVQKIEIYEDAASIIAKDITKEQSNEIVNKINEKYGTEIQNESLEIKTIPHFRLRNMMSRYIFPFAIATILIVVYVTIRYRKLDKIKVIGTTIVTFIELELLLFGIIAITRIPIGRLTLPMILVVYVLALAYCIVTFEKKMIEINENTEKE